MGNIIALEVHAMGGAFLVHSMQINADLMGDDIQVHRVLVRRKGPDRPGQPEKAQGNLNLLNPA